MQKLLQIQLSVLIGVWSIVGLVLTVGFGYQAYEIISYLVR